LVSGSEDSTIKIWEVETGRCLETHKLDGVVQCVAWNPNPNNSLIAVAYERSIILINPLLTGKKVRESTDSVFNTSYPDKMWTRPDKSEWEKGRRALISVDVLTSVLKWHSKGKNFLVF
jgi:ribosome biogenesis protein ERB1